MLITNATLKPKRFRFSEDFLAPYYKEGDPFQSLLARSTYLNKYCRDKETWTDTIRRVVEANLSMAASNNEQEAKILFHLFWTGQALPPGRGLWTGGVEGIPADARYNCFSGETRFWANGTLTSFEDSVGQTVEVLCQDGTWRPAEVKSFGKQALRTIRMAAPGRSKFSFEFVATPGHRWVTSNRGLVEDLRVGDRVLVTPREVSDLRDTQDFKDGFAHGFMFGDGTKETQKDTTYKIRLCGEKDWQHKDLLKQASNFSSECSPPSYNGDPVLFFKSPTNLRRNLPEDSASPAYQVGFIEGWLAADGSWRASGVGGNRLNSINATAIDWAIERLPLLGYCPTGRYTDSNEETNYGKRSAPMQVLTVQPKPVEYTVRSITDEGREEEVYCVVEPETKTFTLEGGVVTGNCWYTTLYGIDDWCWTANQLMLGGGVGVGLGEIDTLPVVQREPQARFSVLCSEIHPDVNDVNPNAKSYLNGQTTIYKVPDSREGWVEALRTVLTSAFYAKDLIVDVSEVRARGMPIRTFGGIACGPGPLTNLLRNSWLIVRGAAGRRLNSVEALDITNYIGLCIKAGNVRRSALIAIGDAYDQAFRDAKKDMDKVISHRHTSNNTIAFRSWEQLDNFDWDSLVRDMAENGSGEPGILNLPLVWKTDAGAKGVNPCGEVPLHDREACNLAEVFPAKFEAATDPDLVFKLITRYCLRQRLAPLLDERADSVQKQNMRVGVGLGGLCDFDWTQPQLSRWYQLCRDEASSYSKELGVSDPIAVTTVKPSGTISLLNGSSPGIHAPYAAYYLRRTRIAKNDPMALAMAEAGVPFEDDVYDASGHTWVFAFPMKSLNEHVTVQNETIRDQFERQKAVQSSWADNAVSATLSFAENERDELSSCFKEYVPFLKSTSALPKAHGYAQAPLEACSKDEYERLYAMIDHKHPLVRGGDFEVEECSTGSCPVR